MQQGTEHEQRDDPRVGFGRAFSLRDPTSETESSGCVILHEAIVRLEGVDPKAAAVVRLRYFAGLSSEQTATALGFSTPTVKRTWAFTQPLSESTN
jgi:DNA-directed RNA polymerase specialized sigma24 family protein